MMSSNCSNNSSMAGQTRHFYWEKSLSNLLGERTCGQVYKGVNKSTGDAVAVKTFTESAFSRSVENRTRELEVTRKVNHLNIVKLLGIEEEESSDGRPSMFTRHVIVMELCTGGSLAKILEDPENAYGLDEDEFLLVLEHLTAGMKYLRENSVIHRDLKPGNIMKFVEEDGRSIYKLADFDTARELPEGEEFMSFRYGTEEYLEPEMYEQALLLPPGQQLRRFGASVDLWSIGVTLYQVATGNLPYKPFLLRKDRPTMHVMTTQKKSGVISAQQLMKDGPIYYSDKLPNECLLSTGLKKLVTPLLAGLTEVDKNARWDFARFFEETKNILERKRLHVFYVNKVNSIRIYLKPEKTYKDLQNSIMEQTKILPENQTLLFKDSTLLSLVGNGDGSAYPTTTKLIPILFCDKENNNIKPSWELSKLQFKLFPNTVDKFEDERIASYNSGVAYVYRRQIQTICDAMSLIDSVVLTIDQVAISSLKAASKEYLQIQSVVRSLSNQFDMMKGFHASCQVFVNVLPYCNGTAQPISAAVDSMGQTYEKHLQDFLKLGDRLAELMPSIKDLLGNRVENRFLMVDWKEKSRQIPSATNIARIDTTATNIINKLRTSLDHLIVKRHEPMPRSSHEQENQTIRHLTERLHMREKCRAISVLRRTEFEVFVKLIDNFSDWYKMAEIALNQPDILTKELSQVRANLSAAEVSLNVVVKEFQSQLTSFTEALMKAPRIEVTSKTTSMTNRPDPGNRSSSIRKLNEHLQKQLEIQKQMMDTYQVHSEVCRELQDLSESINNVKD